MKRTRVLIVDDHPVFRRGLRSLIDTSRDFVVVGEADNGRAAIDVVGDLAPDLFILDVEMPVLDGLDCARELRERYPEIKVVFLTLHRDRQILKAMRALGVSGYILKDSALDELIVCIQTVIAGEVYESRQLSHLGDVMGLYDLEALLDRLTPAERAVLRSVAESKTSNDIARELFVSIRTIQNHRSKICEKFGVQGNNALLRFALENRKAILRFCTNDRVKNE